MLNGWRRSTRVVGTYDPTEVVVWQKGDIVVSEFQGIYTTRYANAQVDRLAPMADFGEELHKALEHGWHLEQEANEERRAEAEMLGTPDEELHEDDKPKRSLRDQEIHDWTPGL